MVKRKHFINLAICKRFMDYIFNSNFRWLTFFFNKFIYLFLAVLGLCFCARAFSSCGKRGPLFITVRGPLTIAASLVAEHRLQMRRLSSCGSRAQLLRCMWDPPRPGLEPCVPWQADSQPLHHQGSPYIFISEFLWLFMILWILWI